MDELPLLFPGSPDEVDAVFAVSVQDLAAGETSHQLPHNRYGMQMAPRFPSDHGDIWGLTALILRPILRNLLVPVLLLDPSTESSGDDPNKNGNDVLSS